MTTLFISDLHLEAGRKDIGNQFLDFLSGEAREADALYILGDLFESWVGDDDPDEHYATVKQSIRTLADSGVPVYFMHGNRDFMIGDQFADECGLEILADPCVVDLHGQNVLLSHGDALCTEDVEYQQIRTMTRDPEWQQMMLEKPLAERIAFASLARAASKEHGKKLNKEISDVNEEAVTQLMIQHGVDILLHGHTHRPDVHKFQVDGRPASRIVLGDWYDQGSIVRWDENGPDLASMPR